jgi:hypothetical protein
VSAVAFEKFKKSWLEEIEKIENRAIDSEGVYRIYTRFLGDVLQLRIGMTDEEEDRLDNDINMLESKLTVALETARSRFRKENFGLWARIAEGIGGIRYRIPKRETTK